jgi:progressive ankylosis protein
MNQPHPLTNKEIFKFWFPLSATWLMMAIEGPFLTALIARMADAKYNLAAYGIAFSLALIMESPVIMMMSASTALVKDKATFQKLRNFTYTTNILTTLMMLILIIPPVFNLIAYCVLNLPPHVADLTYKAVAILLPWPSSIGYRRFYQGIMIANGVTKKVAYGTIVRVLSMGITAVILYALFNVDGVIIGAASLSAGVIMEAVASRFMVKELLKSVLARNCSDEKMSYKSIFRFYYPLAATSVMNLAMHPMVTFFIGQSRNSLESLAVLPVLNSLVFIFRSFGLSYQEAVIALINKTKNYTALRNFERYLAFSVVAGLAIISFTPLADFWFLRVSGLSGELTSFAKIPLMLYTIFPALTVLISFQRGILVCNKNTQPITMASILEVVGVGVTLFITIKYFDLIGVTAAIIAYIVGRLLSNFYLASSFFKARNGLLSHNEIIRR